MCYLAFYVILVSLIDKRRKGVCMMHTSKDLLPCDTKSKLRKIQRRKGMRTERQRASSAAFKLRIEFLKRDQF